MRILITGSNSGFGKLASLTLARQGHHVIATMRSLDKSAALRAEAAAERLDIEIRQLDVCDRDSIASALADAADIDVLVNNAGFEVQGAPEMIDDDLMQRQLDTNVLGPLRTIRSVMPAWRERGHVGSTSLGGITSGHSRPCDRARSVSDHRLRVQHRPTCWMGGLGIRSQGPVTRRSTDEPRFGQTLRPPSRR